MERGEESAEVVEVRTLTRLLRHHEESSTSELAMEPVVGTRRGNGNQLGSGNVRNGYLSAAGNGLNTGTIRMLNDDAKDVVVNTSGILLKVD